MAEIKLDGVSKRFADGYEAVKDIDLEIADGEFMILVGPSGCGKSTALRMIAGLEDISEGELTIGGKVVNGIAPKDRDIAMVFQTYALYPHMTVRENMAFPLKLAKAPQEEIDKKVGDAAKILDLDQHLDRKPANLSGGQRQRVAMGRAIVRDPKAFLMDEPLSNLDAKLRVQMRTEVAKLQSDLGTTTVYVTHDQTEAMTLGDRVAVMRSGTIQQVGSPQELYDAPANLFVAGIHRLAGDELHAGDARGRQAEAADRRDRRAVRRRCGRQTDRRDPAGELRGRGDRGRRRARPRHHLQVEDQPGRVDGLGEVRVLRHRGRRSSPRSSPSSPRTRAPTTETSDEHTVVARLDAASQITRGDEAELWVDTSNLHLFDADSGERLNG